MRITGLRTLSAALLLAMTACASPVGEVESARLATFKQNSKRFYDAGLFRRAEDQCRKGLLVAPDDLSLNEVLGFSLLRQGGAAQIHEAAQVFQKCIDIESEFDFRSRLGLGEAQYQLGLIWSSQIGVIEADEKLTREEREEQLAQAREQMEGCYADAESALLAVLASPRGRDDVQARSTLARLYAVLKRYEEAAEVARTMIATLSNSIRLRSENMSLDTLPDERREAYEQMLARLEERRVEGLKLLATIADKLKRYEEVTSVYAQLEALAAMEPADYYNRARAYEALRSREAAIQDYETFVHQAASRGAYFVDAVADAMRRKAHLAEGGEFRAEL